MRCAPQNIILLLLLFCLSCGAQTLSSPNDLLFSSFFAEKNLSSSNILCFFQDSKGYMWIGTEDGLNFFNGKTIQVFRHDHLNKNSLAGNRVGSVSEDKEGFIWVGTSQGISRLDPELLIFENYFNDNKKEYLGYKANVYVDRENTCWAFATDLFRYNRARNHFEKFNLPPEQKPHGGLYNGIYEDAAKRFWLSTSENLYRIYPDKGRCEEFYHFQKDVFFFPVKEDPQGNLYCGTWDHGLYRIDPRAGRLDTIEKKGLISCYTTQQLNNKTVLWYNRFQLSTLDLKEKQSTSYFSEAGNPYTCKNGDISCLFTDAQNQLWIGYASKGIQILSPSNQGFKTYHVSEKNGMFPSVNCFVQTKDYSYVGGWYNYSLVRLDKQNKPLKSWFSLSPSIGHINNNITDAWSDRKGNIWLTSTFGLIKFNEATEKSEIYKLDTSVTKRSFFLEVLPEGDSVLWLSGYFCGLSRFSLKTKTFRNWGADIHCLYWGITRDNSGMLWIADNAGVLLGFDPKTEQFTVKKYEQLTEGAIFNSILFDSLSNALWLTSANGLLRVDRKTFAARLFTDKDNLPTSQVNAVQLDQHHRLWIATNKGLCFYDPKHAVVKTFFSNNGLPGNVLNQMFRMQPNGDLYIGYRDGFSVLQTNALQLDQASTTEVSVLKIYEAGRLVPIKEEGSQKTIELNHDQNDLQIEFAANDLINSEDNRLLFRLEGYDKDWNITPEGLVNYSKLAPGKYLFHASSINHSGLRATKDDFLSIIIYPPFWKTTWFITIITLCLFALTLFATRYVFTRNLREKILILEKEQAVERERSRISQDMHDELGSGLTKISIMSEVAKTQLSDTGKARNQLESISSSSRELVDNLQDIIWILNPRNDSLENLCAYIREYALKFFEHSEIRVLVEFPEHIRPLRLSEDQRRNILLVFKESFNNISKHSHCSDVVIKMSEEKEWVRFTILDNGKGFERDKIRNFANGLSIMEKRMARISGSFLIHSEPQRGTRSELEFKA